MRFDWRPFEALGAREVHDLLRLRAEVFVVEQRCIFADIDGRDPDALHLLARADDGRLAGTLRLFGPAGDGRTVEIGRVTTALEARGTGLGRALMVEAIKEARRRFAEAPIAIAAQSRLEGFYAGLGFRRLSADYDEDGILHCAMIRGDL